MGKGKRIERKPLTAVGIAAAQAKAKKEGRPVWVADGFIQRSQGGLQVYVHPAGTPRFYWRYTTTDGRKIRKTLGPYTKERAEGALTIADAHEEVKRLAALYQDPESRDVVAFQKAEAERMAAEQVTAKKAEAERIDDERRAAEDASKYTLMRLMEVYVEHLQAQGKGSAYDAANIVKNHLTGPCPEIANKPARVIKPKDVTTILRTLTDAGKGRTAAKLRAYLRAAYALAARAETDAEVPGAFIAFGCESNPVAVTGALSKFNKALERALTDPELRAFWMALDAAPVTPAHDALRLAILLGGQRPAQLLRATVADVDLAEDLLTLRDPKGRRQQARLHVLPLTEKAREIVERCLVRAAKRAEKAREGKAPGWLFSTFGTAALRPETVTSVCGEIATKLLAKPKAERVIVESFSLRDIRRTCETRMAALGVSKDLRAQLQSHGLGGVQGRHYDKHDYLPEKRAALESWAAYLDRKPADNVTDIKRKKKAAA